jgi:hypothetical protein
VAHADSSGTPVTLTVTTAGTTAPPPSHQPHGHLPFTGFSLITALVLGFLLIALGAVLTRAGLRSSHVRSA